MPSYYDQEETEMDERVVARPGLQGTRTFLALTAIYCYYLFSCGLEGFFQSMTYTYALCGPLSMTPASANTITAIYYAAFMTGRCSGIFFPRLVSPTKIIIASITGCFASSLLLSVLGSTYTA